MKKLGGKSIKFNESLAPYQKPPAALTGDKQSKEFVLTMAFAHIKHYHGMKITKIEVNPDDSHGKPDTIIVADGEEIGIQLTKLSLNEPLRRINISERQTNEFLNLLPEGIQIPKPLNVSIYLSSKDKNAIPKGSQRKKKRLAELVASKINDNRDILFAEDPEMVWFKIDDNSLKDLAHTITINPIKQGYFSPFKGREGVNVNYEFDTHNWNETDLNEEIERIIESKKGGTEDLLLIWADRFEMLYQDQEIALILREKFSKAPFTKVYFLSLFDRIDKFMGSWKMWPIK